MRARRRACSVGPAGPRTSTTWRLTLAATAGLLVLTAAPVAADDPPPAPDPDAPAPESTTSTVPGSGPLPLPTTTTTAPPADAPATEAPTVPAPPASATPSPGAAPNTLLITLGPDVNPFPVEMSASAPDLSGAFGAAEGVAALARLRVDEVAVTAAEAAATLADAQAALATVQSEADAAARTASDSRDQADAARRAAVAAATDSLVASRNGMHPTTALAVHGEVAPDELWAYGFRRALALPVGERVVETRSSAARAGRDERAADDALGEARALVESRTAEHDAAQAELTQAQTELAAADAAVVAAKDAAFSAFTGGTATPENLRVSVLDIPTRTLDAYLLAERRMAVEAPACRMRWWVVAGIGAVESGHGTYRGAYPGADGNVVPRIIGPRLDGGAFARIGDTDRGRLDGDTDFDRAVGPMQFIPSTWASSGRDGNGDGVADPHNIYDAAYAAAGYLCRGARGGPVDSAEGFAAAAWSYNRSRPYGATTWQRAVAYSAVSPRVVGGLSDLP